VHPDAVRVDDAMSISFIVFSIAQTFVVQMLP